MSKKNIGFIFIYCLILNVVKGQAITPYALNNGGGSSSFMEWSITESVSVNSFIGPGFSLNTGVLQPNTNVVTSINEYGPLVFGSQIQLKKCLVTNN